MGLYWALVTLIIQAQNHAKTALPLTLIQEGKWNEDIQQRGKILDMAK